MFALSFCIMYGNKENSIKVFDIEFLLHRKTSIKIEKKSVKIPIKMHCLRIEKIHFN
jgi:hypothetical protein